MTLFKIFSKYLIIKVVAIWISAFGLIFPGQAQSISWKAGTAKALITPETSLWMAGYGHRDQPSQGKYSELWLKVLALEDVHGNQAVLITSDLLGIPKNLSNKIRTQIYNRYGLTKAQIILNSSHTHSGPVLEDALYDIYPLDDVQRQRISAYSKNLESTILSLTGEALANLQPASIFSGNGTARFQVNRRNNEEKNIEKLTSLKGPNDHAVPVIKIFNEQQKIMAMVFGYACHPTVLDHYNWSGDYPGYAQEALEKRYPGAMALFFQGAGGDQNPLPRRTLPLAKQYGGTLALSVERVLEEEMKPLHSRLQYIYREIDLNLMAPPTPEELEKIIQEQSGYMKRWAERILSEMEKGVKHQETYPYPIQIWKLGEQSIFVLGGEATIGYANKLKEAYGNSIFVMGYSNDVMGYIPTEKIFEEGGYEGHTSQMVYGLPNIWKPGLEDQILSNFEKMTNQLGIDILK